MASVLSVLILLFAIKHASFGDRGQFSCAFATAQTWIQIGQLRQVQQETLKCFQLKGLRTKLRRKVMRKKTGSAGKVGSSVSYAPFSTNGEKQISTPESNRLCMEHYKDIKN